LDEVCTGLKLIRRSCQAQIHNLPHKQKQQLMSTKTEGESQRFKRRSLGTRAAPMGWATAARCSVRHGVRPPPCCHCPCGMTLCTLQGSQVTQRGRGKLPALTWLYRVIKPVIIIVHSSYCSEVKCILTLEKYSQTPSPSPNP
jgi:hypothetical protein